MMLIGLVLLAIFFMGGLLQQNLLSFPTKKLMAWSHSLFAETNSSEESHVHVAAAKSTSAMSMAEIESKAKMSSSSSRSDLTKRRSSRSGRGTNKAEMSGVFSTFDKNKDGFITKQELRESLNKIAGMQVTEAEAAEMVEKVDSNGDGLMDLNEFCQLLTLDGEADLRLDSDLDSELKEAFDIFDGNGDGLITVDELGKVLCSMGLKEGQRLESCREMIRKVDADGDGMVNFHEFKTMMIAPTNLLPRKSLDN